MSITATYSPDDNKIRLYTVQRLDPATYARVNAAGFGWAPKQELFVAPAWTPEREDLALELAGDIDDEDTSLVERAEERAERFGGYSERRADEAQSAQAGVERIMNGIPLGQPVLLGHHSERHARRDAARIENGLRKAVRLFDTARYWTRRAEGAVATAKYKELPDVRARRIKGLEADKRKHEREKAEAERWLRIWTKLHEPGTLKKNGDEVSFRERAMYVASVGGTPFGTWSELSDGKTTPEEVQAAQLVALPKNIAYHDRWLTHLENRLSYERAMLDASGYRPPAKPKTAAVLPLLNYAGEVAYRDPYRPGTIIRVTAVAMTKAEWAKIHDDYKGTRISECGTHRVRTAIIRSATTSGIQAVYLSDQKAHPRPSGEAVQAKAREEEEAAQEALQTKVQRLQERAARPTPAPDPAAPLRAALAAGTTVVSAPQLFPTPQRVVDRMLNFAELETGKRVLEPSSGTGAILEDLRRYCGVEVVGIEIVPELAKRTGSICADFLTRMGFQIGTFDTIVMNPPFANGQDIAHIRHAMTFLKPRGRLVALCAAGPRQEKELKPLASHWEVLEDAFREQGTGVRVALMVYDRKV